MSHKVQTLDCNQLSFLFISFNRHLFTSPTSGDIESGDLKDERRSCTLYFTQEFYDQLIHEGCSYGKIRKKQSKNGVD